MNPEVSENVFCKEEGQAVTDVLGQIEVAPERVELRTVGGSVLIACMIFCMTFACFLCLYPLGCFFAGTSVPSSGVVGDVYEMNIKAFYVVWRGQ